MKRAAWFFGAYTSFTASICVLGWLLTCDAKASSIFPVMLAALNVAGLGAAATGFCISKALRIRPR